MAALRIAGDIWLSSRRLPFQLMVGDAQKVKDVVVVLGVFFNEYVFVL